MSSGLRITLPELLLPGVGFLPFNPTFSYRKFSLLYPVLCSITFPSLANFNFEIFKKSVLFRQAALSERQISFQVLQTSHNLWRVQT